MKTLALAAAVVTLSSSMEAAAKNCMDDIASLVQVMGPFIPDALDCQTRTGYPLVPPTIFPSASEINKICSQCQGLLQKVKTSNLPTCTLSIGGANVPFRSILDSILGGCGKSTTRPLPNPPAQCTPYEDIDFVGNDLASKTNKKASECCSACSEYSGCTAYAWNAVNGGTCYLKKSVGQVEYKPGVISSSLLPLYGGVCPVQYELDYVGNDIGNVPSRDSGVCCGQCKANSACKAYTWSNYNGGTCWMKSGKGSTVYKAGVTSGTIVVK